MLTVPDAFENFRSRLEISTSEQEDASSRQQKIREQVREGLDVERDFLTGSYARHTKTKPLKDVDIFVVLKESESSYLDLAPDVILSPHYPGKTSKGNRSVKIDRRAFATPDEQVLSFDIVPAFAVDAAYSISDRRQGVWIKTNPDIHREKATAANQAFEKRWKPVVKMVKKWNDHNDKPVKPSFLLEVMALELLDPPWARSYPRELRQFFASAAQALDQEWADPAGLGPPVTARLAENSWELQTAKQALRHAEAAATEALRLDQSGRPGAALDSWQEFFGARFAKS